MVYHIYIIYIDNMCIYNKNSLTQQPRMPTLTRPRRQIPLSFFKVPKFPFMIKAILPKSKCIKQFKYVVG